MSIKMKEFVTVILALLLCMCIATEGAQSDTKLVTSPGGLVSVKIETGKNLTWSVVFKNKPVLQTSPLGLVFKNQPDWGEVKLVNTKTELINKTWNNRFSKKKVYIDQCCETTIELEEVSAPKRKLAIIVRAYDDGLAFRYCIPKQKEFDHFVLLEERTQYRFTGNWDCWASDQGKFNTSQEKHYSKQKLSDIKKDGYVICPLVIHSEEFGYCALTEADLLHWSGMQFAASDMPYSLRLRLTPRRDGNGLVTGQAPIQTPWRVMLLGSKPVDLINNSGIILNVSTPCIPAETDWIQPGTSSWDWWTKGNSILTTETFKSYVDLAVKMGWKYTTLDSPWYFDGPSNNRSNVDPTKGNSLLDIHEALRYADSKGIGVFVWIHYKDLIDCTREKAFSAYEKLGIKGIKVDFMDSDCQEMVEWLNETAAMCARHHLMINYHGMYKPVGFERTYPNNLTREGVLGNEFHLFGKLPSSEHCATLPFTRYLCGPGDYTPGGFLNTQPEHFKVEKRPKKLPCMEQGTRAHALAMCLVIDSPLLTICDSPKNYKDQPGAEMLKNIPSVWDNTIALDGEIGKYYLVARQSGETCYAAAITNQTPRTLTLPLTFLKSGKTYTATIYADKPESDQQATAIAISTQKVKASDTLSITMVRNGGWNAIFTPDK